VRDHLDSLAGRLVRLLMETPRRGRTEGFAKVELAGREAAPGSIVEVRIDGREGEMLRAAA
jgi:tRNA A37 methylthiotransferase MiaB